MKTVTERTTFPEYINDIIELNDVLKRTRSMLPEQNPNLSNSRINRAITHSLRREKGQNYTIGEMHKVAHFSREFLWAKAQSDRFENFSDPFIESE